jgi:lysozyme
MRKWLELLIMLFKKPESMEAETMDMKRLRADLVRHEGMKLKPYKCTAGKLTIGIGRNIEDKGISEVEAFMMLDNDIFELRTNPQIMEIIAPLNSVRQEVIINMAFNLGVSGLLKFRNMLAALKVGNYRRAASEMLDSMWSVQVGNRAIELSERMKKGEIL